MRSKIFALVPALVTHAGLLVIVATMLRPAVTALLVVALAFINPALLPPIVEFGELSFRYPDVFFVVLLVAFFGIAAIRSVSPAPAMGRLLLPLAPFLAWIGFSLSWVAIHTPNLVAVSATSYLRLMQTVLFGLLAHMAFRSRSDIRLFQRGFVFFSIACVAIGMGQLIVAIGQSGILAIAFRYNSVLGEHALGLVAGLCFLLGLLWRDNGMDRRGWSVLLIVGFLGLFLSKSASAIFATTGTVAIFLALRERLSLLTIAKVIVAALILLCAAILAVILWRSADVVGVLMLTGGSYAQRIMIYYAGVQIFLANPIVGAGWMTTATSAYIGSPEFNDLLMSRFPLLPEWYFFIDEPQSLHNMYLQFLAELGLAGFVCFVVGVVVMGRRMTTMLRSMPAGSVDRTWAGFYALSVVFLLIWWNTGPLFGGQTESVLLFVLIGLFASTFTLSQADGVREGRP